MRVVWIEGLCSGGGSESGDAVTSRAASVMGPLEACCSPRYSTFVGNRLVSVTRDRSSTLGSIESAVLGSVGSPNTSTVCHAVTTAGPGIGEAGSLVSSSVCSEPVESVAGVGDCFHRDWLLSSEFASFRGPTLLILSLIHI